MITSPESPTQEKLHALWDTSASAAFQSGLVRSLVDGYQTSWAACEASTEREVTMQAWSYSRWTWIDSALLSLGRRFRHEGVEAEFVVNTVGTAVKHTELRVGPFILTAAMVEERDDLPRPAEYRDLLMYSNAGLFSGPSVPKQFWVPLLHIPDLQARMPQAVYIAFPDGDGGFACEHIDLLQRFPLTTRIAESIQDRANPIRVTTTKTSE